MINQAKEPAMPQDSAGTSPDIKPAAASVEQQSAAPAASSRRPAGIVRSVIVLVVFVAMLVVNALANILPINNLSTGEISDAYPNLFAPAGLTFSIWGLIYLLLAAYAVFQFFQPEDEAAAARLRLTQWLFVISSLANIAWIFCWHYLLIPASLGLMLVILVCLILINHRLTKEKLGHLEWLLLRLPFSVYFGWITVATVANVTILLVDLGWGRFGLSEAFWTVVVLAVATLIALAVISKNRDWAYGAVLVWAYAGILIKHLDADLAKGFAGQYITVIVAASICLGFVAAASLLALIGRKVQMVGQAGKK